MTYGATSDRDWQVKYTPDDGNLVNLLYLPALDCAVRYDRLTGYFQAKALVPCIARRGRSCAKSGTYAAAGRLHTGAR